MMMGASAGWMWIVPIAVVVLAVWLFRQLVGDAGSRWSAEDRIRTEELLRERFAAGELDPDDFERRLAAIRRRTL